MSGMTKGERHELGSLIRKREKVMKAQAQQRSAELLAEFDAASAKIYHWDDDDTWAAVHRDAQAAIDLAKVAIAERCKELGIPPEFAPGLDMFWHGRGHNAVAQRRTELRRAAKSRIEAIEAQAVAQIERLSLQAQTEVIAQGLESEAAMSFLEKLPDVKSLMPPVGVEEIQSLVEVKRAQQKQLGYLQ